MLNRLTQGISVHPSTALASRGAHLHSASTHPPCALMQLQTHSHRLKAASFTEGLWSDAERCRTRTKEVLLLAAWLSCLNQAYENLTGLKSHQHMP